MTLKWFHHFKIRKQVMVVKLFSLNNIHFSNDQVEITLIPIISNRTKILHNFLKTNFMILCMGGYINFCCFRDFCNLSVTHCTHTVDTITPTHAVFTHTLQYARCTSRAYRICPRATIFQTAFWRKALNVNLDITDVMISLL